MRMSEFKIEHDVKLPGKVGRGRNAWVDLCRKMRVAENGKGDSVRLEDAKQAHAVRAAALKNGMKLTVREQPDGSYRVWRLK